MRRLRVLVVLALVAHARPSFADDTACIAAVDEGQTARDGKQLLRARELFVRCGAAECPKPIRDDCVAWLDDVTRRMPTAVFFADAGPGRDVTDVRVLVDGTEVVSRLDGRSVPVEPGAHRVLFQWRDRVHESTVLFVEGEKNRKIEARFLDLRVDAAVAPQDEPTSRRHGAWPWVAGGVGVLGLGGFAIFGLSGRSDVHDLDACAPRCDPGAVDSAQTKYLLADISLGVAIVGLGVATYLFLTDGPAARVQRTAR